MAQQLGIPGSQSSHGRFADAFVIFSVTVLSMALGAWFLLQLGLSLWPGMAAALSVYTALLLFHLLVRRSLIDAGGEEPREEMQWIAGEPDLAVPASDRRERSSLSAPFAADGEPSERLSAGLDDPHALPDPSTEIAFHYRPRDTGGSLGGTRVGPRPPPNPVPPHGAGEAWQAASSPSPSEKNVELIQDLIKKLADELSDVPRDGADPCGARRGPRGCHDRPLAGGARHGGRLHAGCHGRCPPTRRPRGGWWPTAEAPSGLGAGGAARPPATLVHRRGGTAGAERSGFARGRGDRRQSHGNPA